MDMVKVRGCGMCRVDSDPMERISRRLYGRTAYDTYRCVVYIVVKRVRGPQAIDKR